MSKKMIKTSDGVILMDLEDVIVKFDKMIRKFACQCLKEAKDFDNSIYDFDDYYQMGLIEVDKVFNAYDVDRNVCFSTVLFKGLNRRMLMILRELGAKKRKVAKNNNISLNECFGMSEMSNVVASVSDEYFTDTIPDVVTFVCSHLTEVERMCIAIEFQRKYGTAKGTHKTSLGFGAELFADGLIELKYTNKTILAEKLGITRPTLNKRIKESMEKVCDLVEYYGYVVNA